MFASLLKKDKTSPLEKGEASAAAQRFFRRRPRVFPSTLVREDEALQKNHGLQVQEELVAKKKPSQSGSLAKGQSQGQSLAKGCKQALGEPWVKLKKTCALKPKPRTYVTGKLKLICEVSSSMTPHHEWVIDRIMRALHTAPRKR